MDAELKKKITIEYGDGKTEEVELVTYLLSDDQINVLLSLLQHFRISYLKIYILLYPFEKTTFLPIGYLLK